MNVGNREIEIAFHFSYKKPDIKTKKGYINVI